MKCRKTTRPKFSKLFCWGMLLACLGATGCQVDVGSQVLPSPYYLTDDIIYHAPGPEFSHSREAAAMQAYSQEQNAGAHQR